MWYLLIFLLAAGCSQAKDKPELKDPPDIVVNLFHDVESRVLNDFLQNGYVVSRSSDGAAQHSGEGILWSGVAMGTFDCENGQKIAKAITGHISDDKGELLRIMPIGEYVGREINFDGETGFDYGVALLAARCPDLHDELAAAWKLRQDYIAAHGGALYPDRQGRSHRGVDHGSRLSASQRNSLGGRHHDHSQQIFCVV